MKIEPRPTTATVTAICARAAYTAITALVERLEERKAEIAAAVAREVVGLAEMRGAHEAERLDDPRVLDALAGLGDGLPRELADAVDEVTGSAMAAYVYGPATARSLAAAFCDRLADHLTPDEIREAADENERRDRATPGHGTCATHDACDPNVAMREAGLGMGVDSTDGSDPARAERDRALENEAWSLAKRHRFDAAAIRALTAW